jgi:putative DNA primase/helicase
VWSILNHLDQLNVLNPNLSSEYVCECPVCNGKRLTISKATGAYSCWTTECPSEDIRAALGDESHALARKNFAPKKYKPAVIDEEIELATFTQPVQADLASETWYDYSQSCRVHRYYEDNQKFTIPYCNGIRGKGKQLWLPYRANEIPLARGKWILGVEGEKCVEYARSLGLVAITWQGSSWTPINFMATILQLKSAGVRGMIYWADLDIPGFRKAEKLWQVCSLPLLPKDKFKLVIVDPRRIWENIKEGQDIADWVISYQPRSVAPTDVVSDNQKFGSAMRNEAVSREQEMIAIVQTVANEMKNQTLRF